MTSSPQSARPRGRPLRDVPIEPAVMRRTPGTGNPADRPAQKPASAAKKPRKRSAMLSVLTVLLLLLIAGVLFGLVAGVFGAMLELETVTVEWPAGQTEMVTDTDVLAAAALSETDRLYGIDADAVESAVLRANPYLADVKLERRLPNTVALLCTPREAAYYLAADGEWFAISADLIVLEQSSSEATFDERGLVQVILPQVQHTVVGRPVEFRDAIDTAYLCAALDAHRASALWAESDLLRINSRFDVRLIVRGSYALTLGSSEDMPLKLELAEKILADSLFAANTGAFLDLSNPSESSAILDKQTDYRLLWRD
ncbi:MAG: FtsQ-type POTRA domain-containing protein [Clostridia bacterium]|nr:FtsQ-type POTRA domain-containing protein [Clostridia bacterium]